MSGAKVKLRYVSGLREVKRGVSAKTIKAVIVAPNIDEGGFEGGLDENVSEILFKCEENEIDVIFALSRARLGRALVSVASFRFIYFCMSFFMSLSPFPYPPLSVAHSPCPI